MAVQRPIKTGNTSTRFGNGVVFPIIRNQFDNTILMGFCFTFPNCREPDISPVCIQTDSILGPKTVVKLTTKGRGGPKICRNG